MLNKEKIKDEIFEIACNGSAIAVEKNNIVCPCKTLSCQECIFFNRDEPCKVLRTKWCNEEYEEYDEYDKYKVDWANVAIDTPIIVSNSGMTFKRYFAGYKDGYVFAWDNGATSWSHCAAPVPWKYARLAILEEIKKNKGE